MSETSNFASASLHSHSKALFVVVLAGLCCASAFSDVFAQKRINATRERPHASDDLEDEMVKEPIRSLADDSGLSSDDVNKPIGAEPFDDLPIAIPNGAASPDTHIPKTAKPHSRASATKEFEREQVQFRNEIEMIRQRLLALETKLTERENRKQTVINEKMKSPQKPVGNADRPTETTGYFSRFEGLPAAKSWPAIVHKRAEESEITRVIQQITEIRDANTALNKLERLTDQQTKTLNRLHELFPILFRALNAQRDIIALRATVIREKITRVKSVAELFVSDDGISETSRKDISQLLNRLENELKSIDESLELIKQQNAAATLPNKFKAKPIIDDDFGELNSFDPPERDPLFGDDAFSGGSAS